MREQKKDPISDYAQRVIARDIIACSTIRNICKSHIKDIKNQDKRGLIWDLDAALRPITFIEKIILLTGGRDDGMPFELLPWQAFVVGSVFGWKRADTGYRRYRRAYIETAKGSGKTPLIAAVALYALVSDGEKAAQIFMAAQTAEQGLVTFKQACHFVEASKHLSTRGVEIYGGNVIPTNILYPKTDSFIRRIASEKTGKGKSGPIPHMVVIDEYHEHDSSATLDWLQAGTKNRAQPIVFITTNAGAGTVSACALEHAKAVRVANGDIKEDSYFPFVCGLDQGDEPFKDEACWIKANPSLPKIPTYEYIRDQVKSCEGMPGRESVVNRLNFCIWTGAETPWLSPEKWRSVEVDKLSNWGDNPVYLSLDLSRRADLTAAILVCDMGLNDDGQSIYEAEGFMWMPADAVEVHQREENIPYQVFADRHQLNLCPGDFIDKKMIARWIAQCLNKYNLRTIVYDSWGVDELLNALIELGIQVSSDSSHIGSRLVMLGHTQGFGAGTKIEDYGRLGMPSSITSLEAVIRQQRIKIKKNPLLRVAAEGSVVVYDQSSNRRFVKEKSRSRIDPMIALTMGVGIAELINSTDGNSMSRKYKQMMDEGLPLVWGI